MIGGHESTVHLEQTTRRTVVTIFIPSASPVFNDPLFIDGHEGDGKESVGVPVPDESPVDSGLESAERVRSELPETWLWSDTTTGYISCHRTGCYLEEVVEE